MIKLLLNLYNSFNFIILFFFMILNELNVFKFLFIFFLPEFRTCNKILLKNKNPV
jgi:hypothetical protein